MYIFSPPPPSLNYNTSLLYERNIRYLFFPCVIDNADVLFKQKTEKYRGDRE